MIGVTIGVNQEYEALAKLAARCVQEMTGLNVVILTEADLMESRLKHPAALKLKIFDFVSDDNIFYFDADWFCTLDWDPFKYINSSSIIACRDFVLKADWPIQYRDIDLIQYDIQTRNCLSTDIYDEIRIDYVTEIQKFSGLKMDCLKWINSGFWIANRNHHRELLSKSQEYYNGLVGHHPQYYEQPAINKAIEDLKIDIIYLNREYNCLVASNRSWPKYLIGLHIKIKHKQDFVRRVIDKRISCASEVKEYFRKPKY